MSEYKVKAKSRKDIRKVARFIRDITGYTNSLYFPIVEFLEFTLPQLVPEFQFEILPYKKMRNKCGETFPAEHKIILNEAIYNKAVNGDGFARLTIAHEIGHLLMHNTDSISLCKVQPGEKLKPYEDPEWQADVFGGELLAPYYLIGGMSINDISKYFAITKKAASTQLAKLHT